MRDHEGLGGNGQDSSQVEPGEGLAIRFQSDVLIESVGLTAGEKNTFWTLGAPPPVKVRGVFVSRHLEKKNKESEY